MGKAEAGAAESRIKSTCSMGDAVSSTSAWRQNLRVVVAVGLNKNLRPEARQWRKDRTPLGRSPSGARLSVAGVRLIGKTGGVGRQTLKSRKKKTGRGRLALFQAWPHIQVNSDPPSSTCRCPGVKIVLF